MSTMSDDDTRRRPAVFRLDDPHVVLAEAPKAGEPLARPRGATLVVAEPSPDQPPATPATAPRRRRWGALFWSALGGLVSMGLSLSAWTLIEDLFARSSILGWLATALAALVALAAIAILVRELAGLVRLNSLAALRRRAETALAADDRAAAHDVVRDLVRIAAENPHLARARSALTGHLDAIIDGRDLVRLAERELMTPLDAQARKLVSDAATRVSLVTALSPRAAVDLLFVAATAVQMIRRLAMIYGGRPGALGLLRLSRETLTHLAVTGGMAAGDSLLSQVVGHGIAARLSARLGEGVLNGLLTARLGVAAIQAIRPLPFAALPTPVVRDLAADLLRRARAEEDPKAQS